MRETLEKSLQDCLNKTLDMITKVEDMYAVGSQVIAGEHDDGVATLRAMDKQVDALEVIIESDCLRLIALHQPVARDLRLLGFILKCLTDIERMGDYVVHVAEDVVQDASAEQRELLGQMLGHAAEMSRELRVAIQNRDAAYAETVRRMDDPIDALFTRFQASLVQGMMSNPAEVENALHLAKVGRSLERIGDHMENIAERIPYWTTGEHARF